MKPQMTRATIPEVLMDLQSLSALGGSLMLLLGALWWIFRS
jgi:hypothetical protein